ncbi:nuclease Le1 [Fomes fomentarius]|nr:nuclease Le1 [Fomes fomentarius]
MSMRAALTAFFAIAICTTGAAAWGKLGHETIGYVAQHFLAPKALAFVQSSLGDTYNQSLGPAAPWADTVRYVKGYAGWSNPLHFVDANDSPINGSCSVQETRDCGKGKCILTAIANYTTRVAQTSLDDQQRQDALKFLDHFLGDIGQPLHVENYEVGGNEIDTKCSGTKTSLHAAWDTGMVAKNIKENHSNTVETYAADLISRIETGSYKSLTRDWLNCTSTTQAVSDLTKRLLDINVNSSLVSVSVPHTIEDDVKRLLARASAATSKTSTTSAAQPSATITPLECPLVWARESNALCCSVVFTYTADEDLCTSSYYTAAVPVIDLQLAKQGYRLAAWLNVIFDGASSLP